MERPLVVPTSTVYMSGKALYKIQYTDKPGMIAQVELTQDQYDNTLEAIHSMVQNAKLEGYSIGYRDALDDISL